MDSITIYVICRRCSPLGFSTFKILSFLVKANLRKDFSIEECEALDDIITAMASYDFSFSSTEKCRDYIYLINDYDFDVECIKETIEGSVAKDKLQKEAEELYTQAVKANPKVIDLLSIR